MPEQQFWHAAMNFTILCSIMLISYLYRQSDAASKLPVDNYTFNYLILQIVFILYSTGQLL